MKNKLINIVLDALEEVKGKDIVTLNVTNLTDVMDTMIVASGNTSRQVKALANSVIEDAKKAVDIGCTGIVISNHGGRQLDGSRSPFDQLGEIVDAVGDQIDVIMDSGIQRGTHVIKALSMGAKAVGGGRSYLYALAAAGQAGVERALDIMRSEIERDMRLMGAKSIEDLSRKNLRFR